MAPLENPGHSKEEGGPLGWIPLSAFFQSLVVASLFALQPGGKGIFLWLPASVWKWNPTQKALLLRVKAQVPSSTTIISLPGAKSQNE